MRVLIDTNVLLRIAEPDHSRHQTASDALRGLRAAGHELLIVPQVIYEFWSVATRTVDGNGLGQSPAYTEALIERFCGLLRLLRDERTIYESWLQLVADHQVRGVNSFDTRLAAAMQRHQITHLLTFNPGDFRRYPHVSLLDPTTVADEYRSA